MGQSPAAPVQTHLPYCPRAPMCASATGGPYTGTSATCPPACGLGAPRAVVLLRGGTAAVPGGRPQPASFIPRVCGRERKERAHPAPALRLANCSLLMARLAHTQMGAH